MTGDQAARPEKATKACVLKKRKNRKPKPTPITKFFDIKKNSQGFSLASCKYEPIAGDHVYVPKHYPEIHKPWLEKKYCADCKLSPCIVLVHQDELYTKAWEEHKRRKEWLSLGARGKKVCEEAIFGRVQKYALVKMEKAFNKKYVRDLDAIPCCITKECMLLNSAWHNGEEEN